MERHVIEAYERLKHVVPEFPESPEHRDDVIVYALNRLTPRYVVTNEGKAVTEASMDSPQVRAAIDVQVLEAFRQVSRVPKGRGSR